MTKENLNTYLLLIIIALLGYIIISQHGTQRYVPWFKYNMGVLDTKTGNGYLIGDSQNEYGPIYIMGENGLEHKHHYKRPIPPNSVELFLKEMEQQEAEQ